jgi:hypothetical protein
MQRAESASGGRGARGHHHAGHGQDRRVWGRLRARHERTAARRTRRAAAVRAGRDSSAFQSMMLGPPPPSPRSTYCLDFIVLLRRRGPVKAATEDSSGCRMGPAYIYLFLLNYEYCRFFFYLEEFKTCSRRFIKKKACYTLLLSFVVV